MKINLLAPPILYVTINLLKINLLGWNSSRKIKDYLLITCQRPWDKFPKFAYYKSFALALYSSFNKNHGFYFNKNYGLYLIRTMAYILIRTMAYILVRTMLKSKLILNILLFFNLLLSDLSARFFYFLSWT